jgi:hypothetical protein
MKYILFLIIFITTCACTTIKMFYSTMDCYPLKGKIIDCSTPVYDCNGRQDKEICTYYENMMQDVKQYYNDTIIDSYVVIDKDTVNRLTKNKKEGKWIEYIPKFSYVRYHFYNLNELKYSLIIYVGNTISIFHNSQKINITKGDTIDFLCYDTVFYSCKLKSEPKIKYSIDGLYDKNSLHSLTYNNRKYLFYHNNKIAGTFEFINSNQQIDSIYNKRGQLIYTCNHFTKDYKLIGKNSELVKFHNELDFNPKKMNFHIPHFREYTEEEFEQEMNK